MAQVNLRLRTWIPQAEVRYHSDQYYNYFNKGDNRNNAMWSTLAYRTSFSFEIDTSTPNYTVKAVPKTNPTVSYVYDRSGKRLATYDEGKAPTTGMTFTKKVGSDDALYLTVKHSVSNPGVVVAPPIKYEFTLKVTRTGSTRITGKHSAFPAYEFWRQIVGKSSGPELIYTFDPRKYNETPYSLALGMKYSVDKGLSYTS